MKRGKKSTVIITPRDERLFHYLFINKVATNAHLQKDIFYNISKQAIHRRMDKLIKSGFLDATYLRGNANRLVYFLSKKSLLKFIASPKEMKRLQRKSGAIFHDLALVDIQRIIKNFKLVQQYLTENALMSGIFDDDKKIEEIRKINPDAIVKVSVGEKTLCMTVEYESSIKYAKRYDKLLSNYYRLEEAHAVLFIAKTLSIQKKVMTAEKKRCTQITPKFFYCLYQDMISFKENTQFKNLKGDTLLINCD